MRHVKLTYKLKASYHNCQSSLNGNNKMSRSETTSCTKPIKTALPEHDIQCIELQAYNKNKEHIAHHAPIVHFEPKRCGGECWDRGWVTEEEVESRGDDSNVVRERSGDAGVG